MKDLRMKLEDYVQIGPHVSVAKKMQQKGMRVGSGDTIWFVIKAGKGMIRDRANIPEDINDILRNKENEILEFKEAKRNVLPNAKESITAFYSFLYPPMDINYFLNDSLSKSKIEFRLAQDESQNRYEVKWNEKQSYAITVPQKGTRATIEYLELK